MSLIRCVVLDDEPLALQLVCEYVRKVPGLELVYSTTKPVEALHVINTEKIDLLFLDIQMPELTGFNLLPLIKSRCGVVLISAYQQYAVKSYEYNIIDYLLKPIGFERFLLSVQKAQEKIVPLKVTESPGHFFVKTDHKNIKVNFSDVFYFEGLRDYVVVHTRSLGKLLSQQPLRSFEETLPNHKFIRIHKSYLVSVEKIDVVEKNKIIINNEVIPIGETYKDAVLKKIGII